MSSFSLLSDPSPFIPFPFIHSLPTLHSSSSHHLSSGFFFLLIHTLIAAHYFLLSLLFPLLPSYPAFLFISLRFPPPCFLFPSSSLHLSSVPFSFPFLLSPPISLPCISFLFIPLFPFKVLLVPPFPLHLSISLFLFPLSHPVISLPTLHFLSSLVPSLLQDLFFHFLPVSLYLLSITTFPFPISQSPFLLYIFSLSHLSYIFTFFIFLFLTSSVH